MLNHAGRLIPNLFILGNPKAGSTFLFHCLSSGIFNPNQICGADSANWKACSNRSYLLTTLGTKKECVAQLHPPIHTRASLLGSCVRFNFWGGPGWGWGWDWYVGPPAPLALWESRRGPPERFYNGLERVQPPFEAPSTRSPFPLLPPPRVLIALG